MYLDDFFKWQLVAICHHVSEAHVMTAAICVANVQEHAAVTFLKYFCDEFRFTNVLEVAIIVIGIVVDVFE